MKCSLAILKSPRPGPPPSIKGCKRFLDRIWALQKSVSGSGMRPALESAFHRTIKKVTEDIEEMKYNTAIAALMTLLNEVEKSGSITKDEYCVLILLVCPFAPHIAEELWQSYGDGGLCSLAKWPVFEEEKCRVSEVEIAVQVNGKLRSRLTVAADISTPDAIAAAKADERVAQSIDGKQIVKELYVPGKLVNLVVK